MYFLRLRVYVSLMILVILIPNLDAKNLWMILASIISMCFFAISYEKYEQKKSEIPVRIFTLKSHKRFIRDYTRFNLNYK